MGLPVSGEALGTKHLNAHRDIWDMDAYWGTVADGTTDNTAAITAAIAAAPAGTSLVFGTGTYLTDQWNIDGRYRFVGQGKNATVIKAKTGATGPLFNANNSSLRPGFSIRGMGWDMTNATGIAAVYLHNVRNGVVDDLYFSPGGTVALQLDLAQGMTVSNVDVFNASQAGFKGTHASSSGNNFCNCFFDATTTTGIYGFLFDGGLDWWCIGCRAFRAPGIAQTLQYGFAWNYTTLNTNATGKLLGCSVDGVSDLTTDSATVAALYLKKVGNCDVNDTFLSAGPVADATYNKCVFLDQVNNVRIADSYLSGHGIEFKGTASDAVKVVNNQFLSGDTNSARFTMTTTPTNLEAHGNTLANGSSNIPITDNPGVYYGALTRGAQIAAGLNAERPTGALFETISATRPTTNSTTLTSGTLYLFGIWLPQGLKVTNIEWACGATALTNGGGSPHYWVSLHNSSKALLRQSTDSTSATIAQNAVKTTALSSAFVTTYEGLHYIGVMVNSGGGTQPTMSNFAGLSAVLNLSPVRAATADTSLVGTAPDPAGATSNIGNYLYARVT